MTNSREDAKARRRDEVNWFCFAASRPRAIVIVNGKA